MEVLILKYCEIECLIDKQRKRMLNCEPHQHSQSEKVPCSIECLDLALRNQVEKMSV